MVLYIIDSDLKSFSIIYNFTFDDKLINNI